MVIHEEPPPNSERVLTKIPTEVHNRMQDFKPMDREIKIEDFLFDVIFTLDPIFHGIHIT